MKHNALQCSVTYQHATHGCAVQDKCALAVTVWWACAQDPNNCSCIEIIPLPSPLHLPLIALPLFLFILIEGCTVLHASCLCMLLAILPASMFNISHTLGVWVHNVNHHHVVITNIASCCSRLRLLPTSCVALWQCLSLTSLGFSAEHLILTACAGFEPRKQARVGNAVI